MTQETLANPSKLVQLLFALDPKGLGGVWLRGLSGPKRDQWIAQLRLHLSESTPWQRVAPSATAGQLLGELDVVATLSRGTPTLSRGWLRSANEGVLALSMAERLNSEAVAIIANAMDAGSVTIAREGVNQTEAVAFGVIAMDEGIDDEVLNPTLADRLALRLDLDKLPLGSEVEDELFEDQSLEDEVLEEVRQRYLALTLSSELRRALVATAASLGIQSIRPALFAERVARMLAAIEGQGGVSEAHVVAAAELVLIHRATQLPNPKVDETEQQQESDQEDESTSQSMEPKELEERVQEGHSSSDSQRSSRAYCCWHRIR